MVDFVNLAQGLTGVFGILQGASIAQAGAEAQAQSIIQAGEVSAAGLQLTAQGFRQSAESVNQATRFNLGVQAINSQRRLSAISRQFQRVTGQQISQQAASGLALTSKSFLQVQAESRDTFDQAIRDFKIDAENQRRSTIFQSQVQQVNLENQARAAEFRAASERVMASNKAAEARFQGDISRFRATQQVTKAIPTLLSQAFSEV